MQIYLSGHTTACLTMNQEYIVPMTEQTRRVALRPSPADAGRTPATIPSTRLKPQMHFSTPCFVRAEEDEGEKTLCGPDITDSPEMSLDILKSLTVEMLTEAVWAVGQDVRDPVGGSVELLLVPLIRLFHDLLVIGVLEDQDLGTVLCLIEPQVFSVDGEPSEEDGNDVSAKGLLHMKLPEAVKLEVIKKDMME